MRLFYLFLIFFSHSTDFFKKFQKYLDWNFFNYDIFWHTKLRFSRLILENGLFLWNQSGFTVVSNRWFQATLEVFFFLDKVSRPKKSQNLAPIHHMLGFSRNNPFFVFFLVYQLNVQIEWKFFPAYWHQK